MKSNHPAGLLIILLGLVFLAIGSHVTITQFISQSNF